MAFPSLWQLLLPNWSGNTLLGVFLIIIGIVIMVISVKYLSKFKLQKIGMIFGAIVLGIGIFFSFIVSFLQDSFASEELTVILIGLIVLILGGIILFYQPKKIQNKK